MEAASKPAEQPATVNKQAAAAVAQSTITALSATGSGGAGSAGSLAAVAQSSQTLLSSGTGSTRSGLSLDEGSGLSTLDINGPGCACTNTECTFTNCSPLAGSSANGSYTYTIDGYYGWTDGHIVCRDLKYSFSGSGNGVSSTNVAVTLNCDLNVTSTSIGGFVQSAGTSSADLAGQNTQYAYSAGWDVTTTYNKVTFGVNHTPTGGSMHVEGTTTGNYGGQESKSSGSADVSFPL